MLSVERWVQPRDLRESVDLPVQEPMRAGRNTKTPSTDQKRQLRRKTATETQADAWRLNPGDQVRGPNGQLITIKDVKPHKTDSSKCVITLDGGGAMIEDRGAEFTIVRGNHRQMSLPENPGLPGGNFNYLPGGSAVEGVDPGSLTGSQSCPNCGGHMRLNQGQLTCTRCNFQTYPGAAGGGSGGGSYAMDPDQAQLSGPSGKSNNSLVHGSKTAADDRMSEPWAVQQREHNPQNAIDQAHLRITPGPNQIRELKGWTSEHLGDHVRATSPSGETFTIHPSWGHGAVLRDSNGQEIPLRPFSDGRLAYGDAAASALATMERNRSRQQAEGLLLRTYAAKYAPPVASAIARRAQAVLDLPEGAQQ